MHIDQMLSNPKLPISVPGLSAERNRIAVAIHDPAERALVLGLISHLSHRWQVLPGVETHDELLALTQRERPDAFVISACFGGGDGLQVLREISSSPAVLIATSPAKAVEAFSLDATDCVMRPLDPARLEAALERLERAILPRFGAHEAQIGRVCYLRGRDLCFAELEEVLYFQAQRKYTRVVLEDTEGMLRTGISEVEQRLLNRGFWRVHRGLLANMRHVRNASRDDLGRMVLQMKSRPEKLLVSRPNEAKFRDGLL